MQAKLGVTLAEASERDPDGPDVQGRGHHRRAGVGKTHPGQRHPEDPGGEAGRGPAGRPDRAGDEADDRGDRLEARTIHRLLEFDPAGGGLNGQEEAALDCNLLVLDETSMVDADPGSHPEGGRNGSAVILVGDVDQLPLGRSRTGAGRLSSVPAWYPWCD